MSVSIVLFVQTFLKFNKFKYFIHLKSTCTAFPDINVDNTLHTVYINRY